MTTITSREIAQFWGFTINCSNKVKYGFVETTDGHVEFYVVPDYRDYFEVHCDVEPVAVYKVNPNIDPYQQKAEIIRDNCNNPKLSQIERETLKDEYNSLYKNESFFKRIS
jgi:hypothetical protein